MSLGFVSKHHVLTPGHGKAPYREDKCPQDGLFRSPLSFKKITRNGKNKSIESLHKFYVSKKSSSTLTKQSI